MLRTFLPGLAALALGATEAPAQDWATSEVCSVETPRIVREVLDPPGLGALEAQAADIANATGRFWRIINPDGAESYLWGTYHSADPLILGLPAEVRNAISQSRVVAVEVNYIHADRTEYREAQMMEGRFKEASDPFAFEPGDGTIAGLSIEISEWIRDRALELGWTEDVDLILSLPGMAEMLLSDPCEDFANGILPIQDDYIQLLGQLEGVSVLALETPDEFISDLEHSPDTARAIVATYGAYLRPMSSNAERATSFALYLEGRLGLMRAWDYAYQQHVHGAEGLDMLQLTDDYLLDFRNKRFLTRLADELTTGGVFVAVGSAHIPGPGGLVALLRDAGYEVKRVPVTGEAE